MCVQPHACGQDALHCCSASTRAPYLFQEGHHHSEQRAVAVQVEALLGEAALLQDVQDLWGATQGRGEGESAVRGGQR